jgi:hypothetical protein
MKKSVINLSDHVGVALVAGTGCGLGCAMHGHAEQWQVTSHRTMSESQLNLVVSTRSATRSKPFERPWPMAG